MFRPCLMPHVPGLRSPYSKVGGLVFFGRMLDKIRLHAAGKLPADYHANLGDEKPGMFDTRCCQFLRTTYEASPCAGLSRSGTDQQISSPGQEQGADRAATRMCTVWERFPDEAGVGTTSLETSAACASGSPIQASRANRSKLSSTTSIATRVASPGLSGPGRRSDRVRG